jgi:hypothetical protein
MADTSATGEPETPPNRVQATTLLIPRPPRMWPTSDLAKTTILSAMPPYSISSPAKMKKGMARNENTFIPEVICWKMTAMGSPSYRMVASADSPMENATGTPRMSRPKKQILRMISAMRA